jgi:type IV pilus assembly protein PilE
MRTRSASGFTLIELVVVIAIVGILAAIAIPSFAAQVRKSHRTEAMTSLQDIQLKLERHRVDNASYATYTMPSIDTTYYHFALSGGTATGYVLTAVAQGDQAKDSCKDLKITNTAGVVTKSATGTGNCW